MFFISISCTFALLDNDPDASAPVSPSLLPSLSKPPEGVPPEVLQGLGLGLGSEIVIGDPKNVEALAMDIVSFIKGFA